MNRIIKFRVWDKTNKRWEDEGVLLRASNGTVASNQPELYDVQQFTGFKDENGKDVFEGDIIETIEETISKGNLIISGEIIYDDGSWLVDFAMFGVARELSSFTDLGIEVIGNVWENPELLDK